MQGLVSGTIFAGLMKRGSLPAAGFSIFQLISSLSYALALTGVLFGDLFWVIMPCMVLLSIELSLRLGLSQLLTSDITRVLHGNTQRSTSGIIYRHY